ncbi:unnamed protein product [Sphagnum balticum]
MNREEEEAPLEDPHVRRNHLARERHVTQSEEYHAADASRRAAQRAMCSDAQIAADASQRAAQRAVRSDAQIVANASRWAGQRAVRSDAQIALENAARANARTFLHFNR